ncbi:BTAD domain-containing putative transcriptional regulator [Cryptosporangium arvum]|uniref:BTAD domain-containing putative transcriptional regulator n=1 Tax=Cryptosporangium arvum TaxID=80871 RepID=UPI0004ACF6E0|nr:BTAD domain-containing putative transcriptional regulator [Cryptosporangium arvum]
MDVSPGTPAAGGSARSDILGSLRIRRNGVEVDLGPRQQAYLLGLLLARAGQPVSVDDLIELIWDDEAPPSALNVVQRYVGALRRLLEPELPARSNGAYLRRHSNGYLFVADTEASDVAAFRALVAAAHRRLAQREPRAALDDFAAALALWRGPAGDGLNPGRAAAPLFASLNEEFFTACSAAAELAVSLGRPQRVLRPLRLAASMAPLHERVQAALVTALAAAGQHAEARSLYERVRARLAEEIGIDPGPAMRDAKRRIRDRPATPRPAAAEPASKLVGRAAELSVLRQAVASVLASGTGLLVVEGDPGIGKTRLLEETAGEATRRGALVVWGHCLEGDGSPSMWPWVKAIGAILDTLPDPSREEWLAGRLGRLAEPDDGVSDTPVLPDNTAQFRLFEHVVHAVGQAARQRPVLLIIDDLHWADVASVQLFGHLAARLPSGVLLIGTLRTRAPLPGTELVGMLAAASRVPGHRRLRLDVLDRDEVAELVRRETGQVPDAAVTRTISARTAGNPFFVRELARLLTADGGVLTERSAVSTGVPSTVRDVVRDRMAGLDDRATDLLQIAALVGRGVDLRLLAHAARVDVQTSLGLLEPVETLGLLEPAPDDPFAYRFAHDLVRESISETTPPLRAPRLHLRIADALEQTPGRSVAERLAHHLWAAGPLADPARTTAALIRAGRSAATKLALQDAERQLRSAARLARTSGLRELELSALSHLTAVVGMRAGYVGAALDLLERAEQLARDLGRELEAADFRFSRRAAYSEAAQLDRSGPLARRLLEEGQASPDPVLRAYGLVSWGIQEWDRGNIGEAFRYLRKADPLVLDELTWRDENRLRRDLQLKSPVMLALVTTLHGDVDSARTVIERLEATAGDDPYVVTIWSTFAATSAALAGEPAWALRSAERGIAEDPGFSFVFFGAYLRMARHWAHAVTGDDPAGAAVEAERILSATLVDPPLSGVATWYGLIAEMWLAADAPDRAEAALVRAEHFLGVNDQRYAEGLVLLLRARLLQARGAPLADVRAAAERARVLSGQREAYLFARRAQEMLDALDTD